MAELQEGKRVNIKKKKARSLYFGVAMDTGELLTVDAVPRGLECKCICPACGIRLEAHKGDKKAHHFAHDTNNECYYGQEMSIYSAFHDFLRKKKMRMKFERNNFRKYNTYYRIILLRCLRL